MRTMYVLALVGLLLATGCSTTTNRGQFANTGFANSNCGGSSAGCATGGCATGDCGTSANFSDYNYNCGPMCGAVVAENQTSSPMGCDANCKVGNSMMSGYFSDAASNMRGKMAHMQCKLAGRCGGGGMLGGIGCGQACGGEICGSDACCGETMPADSCGPDCGTQDWAGKVKGFFAGAKCKGLGASVGCSGCGDCGGGGSAIGLNNSNCAGCMGDGACKLGSKCLNRRQIPHTANAAATGMGGSGFGQGGSAPTYAYPYYTTRGPRDFLQDGCGPPPIYPSNPRPNCLPTIGG